MIKSLIKNKNLKFVYILVLFFCIAFCVTSSFNDENSIVDYKYNFVMEGGRSPLITKDTVISQKFISTGDNLSKIGIRLLMPSISLNSKVNIKVIEGQDKEIYNKDIFLGTLKDGDFLEADIGLQKDSKNKEYEILITGIDGDNYNSAQFPYSTDKNDNLRGAFVFNEKQENNFLLQVTYNLNNWFQILFWIILFVSCTIYVLFFISEEINEKAFLKLAILLGAFFIIYTPIFHNFDEWDHFFRVILTSQGQLNYEINEEQIIGGTIPDNIEKYLEVYKGNKGISLKNILVNDSVFKEKYSERYTFVNNKYFSTRLPIAHIIPAIGTIIGRYLFNNIYLSVILGRLTVYIVYCAMCYMAIKNVKYYKSLFFVISTTPVAFWIAGTISVDPILNAASLLFISICFKYMTDETSNYIKILDLILLSISAIFLIVTKFMVGLPILILFFWIPKRKFKDIKLYIAFIIFAIIIGGILMIWQIHIMEKYPIVEDRNENVNSEEQIEYIKKAPIAFLRLFTNEMQETSCIWLNNFSYDGIISGVANSTGFILILAALLEKNKSLKIQKNKFFNIVSILLFFIIMFGSMLAMYLNFTTVGKNILEGFQLRYLIFPMILFLVPISNIINIDNNIRNYDKILIFIMLITNVDLILGEIVKAFATYHINY